MTFSIPNSCLASSIRPRCWSDWSTCRRPKPSQMFKTTLTTQKCRRSPSLPDTSSLCWATRRRSIWFKKIWRLAWPHKGKSRSNRLCKRNNHLPAIDHTRTECCTSIQLGVVCHLDGSSSLTELCHLWLSSLEVRLQELGLNGRT